jgi:IrrE N-terminal-like domain
MSLPRGFRAMANRIALALRIQAKLAPEAPIDLVSLSARLGLSLVPLSSFAGERARQVHQLGVRDVEAFSALLLPIRPRQRIILINDNHSLERQNSSIAHEISHALLAHPPPLLFDDAGRRYADQAIEDEANCLAGHILIPNEAAWHIVRSRMAREAACRTYGASPTMLEFRLNKSGARIRFARLQKIRA